MKRIPMALAILMAAASLDAQQPAAPAPANDPIRTLVSRLDLEKYKATIKGLTAFGDRRQGTTRNRQAVDWIEAQLKSYGCANVERIVYEYKTPPPRTGGAPAAAARRPIPNAIPTAQGGGRPRGIRARTGVNNDPMKQPDEKLRALNIGAGHRRRARRRSTAPRSARRVPTRCTSSARTWTATAGAKRPTTTAPARRW